MRRTHERVASVTRRSRSRAEPAPGLARGQGCGGRRAGQPIRPAGGCKPHNSMFRNRGRPDWEVEACRQDVDGREHRASQRKCPGSLAEGWPRAWAARLDTMARAHCRQHRASRRKCPGSLAEGLDTNSEGSPHRQGPGRHPDHHPLQVLLP